MKTFKKKTEWNVNEWTNGKHVLQVQLQSVWIKIEKKN